jgi:osmotically-inducible protein OsmY
MRVLIVFMALCALAVVIGLSRSRSAAQAASGAADPVSTLPVALAGDSANKPEALTLDASPTAFQSADDVKLAAQVRTAILGDSRVSAVSNSITIVARAGVVTLQGRVNDQEQKSTVEAVTRGVPGVVKVDNLLVAPGN